MGMNCPRCSQPLALQDLFTAGVHATVAVCLGCGGHWMRDSDLKRLSEVVEPVVVEWRRIPPSTVQQKPLVCPECEDAPPLHKLQNERDAKVVLDSCEVCGGVWLDPNELRAIQQESLFSLLAGLARNVAD